MKEITGIISYHLRVFLHLSQYDLPTKGDSSLGILSIKTFKKLPIDKPIINNDRVNINIIIFD